MQSEDWKKLPKDEQLHFYRCPTCGEMVDNKSLQEVTEHHSHVLHPDFYPGLFAPALASFTAEDTSSGDCFGTRTLERNTT